MWSCWGRRAVGGDRGRQRPRVSEQQKARKKCKPSCEKNKCKDCGGAGICEHSRDRSKGKDTGSLHQKHLQGLRGRRHLPAQPPQERMQGLRRKHLPA
jgi:hypothetical protein